MIVDVLLLLAGSIAAFAYLLSDFRRKIHRVLHDVLFIWVIGYILFRAITLVYMQQ